MATSNIGIDTGSTVFSATNTISEDAITKHVPRSVLNTSAGVEAGTSASPLFVSIKSDLGVLASVTSMTTLASVTSIGTLASVTSMGGIGGIGTLATLTSAGGIGGMGTLASVTSMSTLAYLTSIGTVASVSSVGGIGSIGVVATINSMATHNVETVASITSMTSLASITSIYGVKSIASITSMDALGTVGLIATAITDSIQATTFIKKTFDFSGATALSSTIWTPAADKRFVICDFFIGVASAGTVTLYDGATNDTANRIAKFCFAANGGAVGNYRKPYVSAVTLNALMCAVSTTCTGFITASGYESD